MEKEIIIDGVSYVLRDDLVYEAKSKAYYMDTIDWMGMASHANMIGLLVYSKNKNMYDAKYLITDESYDNALELLADKERCSGNAAVVCEAIRMPIGFVRGFI